MHAQVGAEVQLFRRNLVALREPVGAHCDTGEASQQPFDERACAGLVRPGERKWRV